MVALLNNHDNFVPRTFIPSFKKAESDFLPGSKEGSGRGRGRGALRGQRGRRGRGAGPPAKVSTPGTYNLQVGTSYFFNMRSEGLSCSLGVLYGGLGISNLQFLIKKIKIIFLVVHFFQF
jgi:hypothetical protein